MNVTINDAINAFNLLREHVNENGFLHECYNLGISALKTVQDGDYQLSINNVPRETLEAIASFDCTGLSCIECKYYAPDLDYFQGCMVHKAREILRYEQNIQEVEAWMKQHLPK